MGAIRLPSLLALIIALAGGVLYAQPAAHAAVMGGRGAAGAAPRAMAGSVAQAGVGMQASGRGVMLPPTGLPPTGSVMPRVVPVSPTQVVLSPVVSPFGSATIFTGNGFTAFPTVPVTGGFTMPLSAIGFGAGIDLVPPVIIGGNFLTTNRLFYTAFGPAIAQSQLAPFVTVGSNIVNVGAQPPFFSTPFGVPVVPSPFISGFAAITVP